MVRSVKKEKVLAAAEDLKDGGWMRVSSIQGGYAGVECSPVRFTDNKVGHIVRHYNKAPLLAKLRLDIIEMHEESRQARQKVKAAKASRKLNAPVRRPSPQKAAGWLVELWSTLHDHRTAYMCVLAVQGGIRTVFYKDRPEEVETGMLVREFEADNAPRHVKDMQDLIVELGTSSRDEVARERRRQYYQASKLRAAEPDKGKRAIWRAVA